MAGDIVVVVFESDFSICDSDSRTEKMTGVTQQ